MHALVMSKTLIVAEKPSVGREIAKVLGVRGDGRGGFIQNDRYVISWAVGHLIGIAEPDEQNKEWSGRWNMNQLPMIPHKFKLAVIQSSQRQYGIVKSLMERDDITDCINATDAGREGELIFRRIQIMAGFTKPVSRLWASDMTEKGLKKALDNTLPDEKKRNLGLAAFARAEADWLVGMNFSRLFTVKNGSLITVGRVQTPVLKLLVDRRREIEHFTPQDYWTVVAALTHKDDTFNAQWYAPPEFKETRIDTEQDALAVGEACRGKDGKVDSVKSQSRQQKPPLPFDLTTLQREANSRFGLSAKDTLAVAQALYERHKLVTYPRTDSRYLTKELFGEILGHMRAAYHHFPEPAQIAAERIKGGKAKFACVNDKKVSDHHAIIPTAKRADKNRLSKDEWNIYEMVCRRFIAAFMPPAKYSATTLWAIIEDHRFKATGKVFKDLGWLSAEPWRTSKDNPLPKLRKGSTVTASDLEVKKHQTKPPSHFTDASLLAAMETAGKLVEDEELSDAMKDRGLGTPATRAQTIETLLSRKYIYKEKKKLIASDAGCNAVDSINSFLPHVTSPEMTGAWEKRLKDIEQGKDTYPAFMHDIRKAVHEGVYKVRNWRAVDRDGFPVAPPSQPSRVHANAAPVRRQLDKDGFPLEDHPKQPPRQKSATDANGFPTAPPQKKVKPPKGDSLGGCPKCGMPVFEQPNAFECAGAFDASCSFTISKHLFGGEVREEMARDLLTKGRTYKRMRGKSKAGKSFNAFLKLENGRIELLFEK